MLIFGSQHTANRLQRWALTLLIYDFEVQHVSTNDLCCADMLSRFINRSIQPEEEYVVAAVNLEEDLVGVTNDTFCSFPEDYGNERHSPARD